MDEKKIDKQDDQTLDKNEEAKVKLDKDDVEEVAGGAKTPIVTPEI